MKKNILIISSCFLLLSVASCGKKAENTTLHSERDTLSWAMGMSLAETAKSGFYNFNDTLVRQAFESVMKGEQQPLDRQTFEGACQYIAFIAQKRQRDDAKQAATQSAQNESEIFSRLLQEKPDIKKTADGYYYEVVKEGKGPKAKLGQRIRFDFTCEILSTGQEYISTRNRESIVHVLGNPMIPGMQSGMQLMNAGSTYIFYFPSNMAFGAQGSEGLPPYTPLKYEIELHEIYGD